MKPIIPSPINLEKLKSAIREDGPDNFHVLADFDQTLTKAYLNGKFVPSLISILRDGHHLNHAYAEKSHALFDKYHPMEIDSSLSPQEKDAAMVEWWKEHFELLFKAGLRKKDIESIVNSGKIKLREGLCDFINFLGKRNIPLVIMSSSGLGGDALTMLLKKEGCFNGHVFFITNTLIWDEEGRAVGVKEPIIHSMNKDETILKNFPAFQKIKDRKNILLLGNTVEDVGMAAGLKYKNLLKIGFLNEKVEENLEDFKKTFDVVLLGDPGMEYINNLLKEIFS
ncbi:hypothetical protein KKD80_02275 [Patescibacteria group bacterium]|nr:hypothetical protein [Patescibacteria group bacterium]